MNCADRLSERILTVKSRVCVGCDPEPDLLPPAVKAGGTVLAAVERFGFRLMEATAPYAAAFKFQIAFYERLGSAGVCILEKHLAAARGGGIPVILDAKRGDVGHTTRAYAEAYLAAGAPLEADAVTVAPYLGRDTLDAFIEVAATYGKGFFVLVKTSNPRAGDLQDLALADGGTLYERTAALVAAVGEKLRGTRGWSSAGAVVGATYPEAISRLRELMPHQYFLLPGVGAQGGDAALLGPAFDRDGLGALVAASRGVAFAWRERPELKWEEAAAAAATALRERVNAVAGMR
jgi:orotidine-5'-phosphate decarboxylase